MKTFICFLLIAFSLEILAQDAKISSYEQSSDSIFSNLDPGNKIDSTVHRIDRLPSFLRKGWKFINADNDSFAAVNWDDSKWKLIESDLQTDSSINDFSGFGWFRKKFSLDSSLVGKTLAITVQHLGASEIYLDGTLLIKYGEINGPDSTEYFNPIDVPFMFTLQRSGEHVIAIRYANYHAHRNNSIFYEKFAGFFLSIETGDLEDYYLFLMRLGISLLVVGGFGFGFFVLHLFMYLFYRRNISNLYFSLFMLCFGFLVSGIFIIHYVAHDPDYQLAYYYLCFPLICILCLLLSAFLNELFANKKRLRLWLFTIFVAVVLLLYFSTIHYFENLIYAILAYACLEALFLTMLAIKRKAKGAWIIGAGILANVLVCLAFLVTEFFFSDEVIQINSMSWGIVLFLAGTISIPVSMSVHQAWMNSTLNKSLILQLKQVKELSNKTLAQELEKQKLLENRQEELEKEVEIRTHKIREQKNELEKEKKKSDELLLNILPSEVAEELMSKGTADAKQYDDVTVMFTDFKNFTQVSEKLSPEELVAEIHYCFKEFDNIISRHNIEKIKTIGDSYMCAGGLPVVNETNAEDIVYAALEIQRFIQQHVEQRKKDNKEPFEIRIGIHTGPVVAGIVGVKKFAYDIWGDTVNIASRMESSGEVGKINISGSTYNLVKDKFTCVYRGKIEAKNKGEVDMYFVEGRA